MGHLASHSARYCSYLGMLPDHPSAHTGSTTNNSLIPWPELLAHPGNVRPAPPISLRKDPALSLLPLTTPHLQSSRVMGSQGDRGRTFTLGHGLVHAHLTCVNYLLKHFPQLLFPSKCCESGNFQMLFSYK